MIKEELKIEEGTISFWIKENSLDFGDNKATQIFNVNPEGGSILSFKDGDNKLKFYFVVIGKGRVDIEHDVSGLSKNERHMITYTWNLKEKKLSLYIDGQKAVDRTIEF